MKGRYGESVYSQAKLILVRIKLILQHVVNANKFESSWLISCGVDIGKDKLIMQLAHLIHSICNSFAQITATAPADTKIVQQLASIINLPSSSQRSRGRV